MVKSSTLKTIQRWLNFHKKKQQILINKPILKKTNDIINNSTDDIDINTAVNSQQYEIDINSEYIEEFKEKQSMIDNLVIDDVIQFVNDKKYENAITKVIIIDDEYIVIKVLNKSIIFSIKKRELLINNNWHISEIDDIKISEKNCCFYFPL